MAHVECRGRIELPSVAPPQCSPDRRLWPRGPPGEADSWEERTSPGSDQQGRRRRGEEAAGGRTAGTVPARARPRRHQLRTPTRVTRMWRSVRRRAASCAHACSWPCSAVRVPARRRAPLRVAWRCCRLRVVEAAAAAEARAVGRSGVTFDGGPHTIPSSDGPRTVLPPAELNSSIVGGKDSTAAAEVGGAKSQSPWRMCSSGEEDDGGLDGGGPWWTTWFCEPAGAMSSRR